MFVFDKSLETGNPIIDSEHKSLIDAINSLLDACASGHGRDKIFQTMQFLLDYTEKHFSHEEKLQQQSGYPDYANHKQLHEGFKRTVRQLAEDFNKKGPTVELVSRVNTQVGTWLVAHIKREDVKVAAHIKSKA